MNFFEKRIYELVKSNPRLKLAIRDVYQRLFDFLPSPGTKMAYPVVRREGFFFGFHDHSPFSGDERFLAGCKFDRSRGLFMPKEGDELAVGVFSGEGHRDWIPVSKTLAWNWHQGCKLQWRGEARELVFNDHLDGINVARVVPVERPAAGSIIPGAIASVSPSGEWAVGYSFERVEKYMPGYGYLHNTNRIDLEHEVPVEDGIYLSNLLKGTYDLLIPIRELREMVPEPSMEGAHHYFSHAIFSPSSKRFVFLHRWVKGDVTKRWSRIVTSDLQGNSIRIYPTKDMASHLGWRNDSELFVYCRLKDGRDRYVLFDDDDPNEFEVVGEGSFNSDGHPAWSPDGRFFVTDTYPDRFRLQYLALYDSVLKKRYDLARLRTFRKFATVNPYKHWACDLHPRWDRSGRVLCFDSTYSGHRSLCTIDFGRSVCDLDHVLSI